MPDRRRVGAERLFVIAELERAGLGVGEPAVGLGIHHRFAGLDEWIDLALEEGDGAVQPGEHDAAMHRQGGIVDRLVDEGVGLAEIVGDLLRQRLRPRPFARQFGRRHPRPAQQPQRHQLVFEGDDIEIGDQRRQRLVIAGDAADLGRDLTLQDRRHADDDPEHGQERQGDRQDLEANGHARL